MSEAVTFNFRQQGFMGNTGEMDRKTESERHRT